MVYFDKLKDNVDEKTVYIYYTCSWFFRIKGQEVISTMAACRTMSDNKHSITMCERKCHSSSTKMR